MSVNYWHIFFRKIIQRLSISFWMKGLITQIMFMLIMLNYGQKMPYSITHIVLYKSAG